MVRSVVVVVRHVLVQGGEQVTPCVDQQSVEAVGAEYCVVGRELGVRAGPRGDENLVRLRRPEVFVDEAAESITLEDSDVVVCDRIGQWP